LAATGTDRAPNGFERTEFEVTNTDHAAFDQDVLENLTIGTSLMQDDDLDVALAGETIQRLNRRGTENDEFFAKKNFLDEIFMIDRTADKCALYRVVEHLFN
jgi:hypothetical protein